ncbi:hypothetical protein C4552_00465 [Candidatus Parcubacteria bacterium]|nr:MAG: hypothetical protein C4552_00465 [Candidatus Parcubacteria bacterium]
MATLEQTIRQAAARWAATAPLSELLPVVGNQELPSTNSAPAAPAQSVPKKRRARRRKKNRRKFTEEERKRIVEALGNLKPGKKRTTAIAKLAGALQATPRQINGVMSLARRRAK